MHWCDGLFLSNGGDFNWSVEKELTKVLRRLRPHGTGVEGISMGSANLTCDVVVSLQVRERTESANGWEDAEFG